MVSLIKCPDCKKKISPRAEVCPNCGCPSPVELNDEKSQSIVAMPPKDRGFKRGCGGCFLIFVAVFVGLIFLGDFLKERERKRWNSLTPQQREKELEEKAIAKRKDKAKDMVTNIQIGMMQKIQAKMRNPDSFDLVKFSHHMKDDNTIRATMRYRGTICIFQKDPVIEMLVLDEPTYSLDLLGQMALREILRAWQGGLVVVSHDEEFLKEIGIERYVELE